jgi:hypothetical protein
LAFFVTPAGNRQSMDSRRRVVNLACIPARSAVSITEALQGDFPPADSRASAEVSTVEEGFMGVEDFTEGEVTGNDY